MGAADVVPGVSGGTVALILGIYERLLTAISHIDGAFFRKLRTGQLAAAAQYADLRFLLALGVGIGVAVVSLAKLMHYLLEHHLSFTYAAFFGLILASGVLVGRLCKPKTRRAGIVCLGIGLVAAGVAYWLVSQEHLKPQPGHGYTFLSGMIAICAMILPGVSGSYLLVMLGKYHEITGIIKDLPKLAVTGEQVVTLAVFAGGCLTGLLLFSRALRWLLARFHAPTMSALCGFMIGSLYKIWPLQIDTTPEVPDFKDKIYLNAWPSDYPGDTVTPWVIAVVACGAVLAVEFLATRSSQPGAA